MKIKIRTVLNHLMTQTYVRVIVKATVLTVVETAVEVLGILITKLHPFGETPAGICCSNRLGAASAIMRPSSGATGSSSGGGGS